MALVNSLQQVVHLRQVLLGIQVVRLKQVLHKKLDNKAKVMEGANKGSLVKEEVNRAPSSKVKCNNGEDSVEAVHPKVDLQVFKGSHEVGVFNHLLVFLNKEGNNFLKDFHNILKFNSNFLKVNSNFLKVYTNFLKANSSFLQVKHRLLNGEHKEALHLDLSILLKVCPNKDLQEHLLPEFLNNNGNNVDSLDFISQCSKEDRHPNK